jgi:hypothetical protein
MRWESVRNPKRYFGDTYTGSVRISRDGNHQVPFESHLERDWLIRTDAFDFRLKSVVAQPRVHPRKRGLPYRFEGRERLWIPDFLRIRRGRDGLQDPPPALVEVKPLIRIYPVHRNPQRQAFLRAREKARWRTIRHAAQARGFGFELATEREIRVNPSLLNAVTMRRCRGRLLPAALGEGRAARAFAPTARKQHPGACAGAAAGRRRLLGGAAAGLAGRDRSRPVRSVDADDGIRPRLTTVLKGLVVDESIVNARRTRAFTI